MEGIQLVGPARPMRRASGAGRTPVCASVRALEVLAHIDAALEARGVVLEGRTNRHGRGECAYCGSGLYRDVPASCPACARPRRPATTQELSREEWLQLRAEANGIEHHGGGSVLSVR